jgi:hypothetical protein
MGVYLMKKSLLKTLSIGMVVGLFITACGSSSSNTSTVTVLGFNGKLVDSGVSGVNWECGDKSGITLADGNFGVCPAGSTVTFSLGSVVLGSLKQTEDFIFTPQDLAGVSRSDTSNTAVLKMASLLQSLDDDGNPSNGINITPAVRSAFAQSTTATSLSGIGSVETLVQQIATIAGVTLTYVSEQEALVDLLNTMDYVDAGLIFVTQPTDQSTN